MTERILRCSKAKKNKVTLPQLRVTLPGTVHEPFLDFLEVNLDLDISIMKFTSCTTNFNGSYL